MDRPSKQTTLSEIEISQAIQDCVKACIDADEPLARLAAQLAVLIAADWSYDDAKTVERGALRVLSTIKADESLWPEF